MVFIFKPSVKIEMIPLQYLFKLGKGSYCLGVFNNGQAGTLIGGISVRNVLVQVRRKSSFLFLSRLSPRPKYHSVGEGPAKLYPPHEKYTSTVVP